MLRRENHCSCCKQFELRLAVCLVDTHDIDDHLRQCSASNTACTLLLSRRWCHYTLHIRFDCEARLVPGRRGMRCIGLPPLQRHPAKGNIDIEPDSKDGPSNNWEGTRRMIPPKCCYTDRANTTARASAKRFSYKN
eukprot:SAG11_NODE_2882_length_2871_cov_3.451659_3_plen_136_part_00